MRYKTLIYILICVFSLFYSLSAFASVEVSSEISKNTATVDDIIMYKVIVSGSMDIDEPEVPGLSDFRLISYHKSLSSSFSQGVFGQKIVFTYLLKPKRTGKIYIAKGTVLVNGVKSLIPPQSVFISTKNSYNQNLLTGLNAANTPAGSFVNPSGGVTMLASVDNPTPYVGQQIVYKLNVYINDSLNSANLEIPAFKDCISLPLKEKTGQYVNINSYNYLLNQYPIAVYPTKSGIIVIEPAKLTAAKRSFYANVDSSSNSVVINVKPLPYTNLKFSNAVGDFDLASKTDKNVVQTGETIRYNIQISGKGNLNSILDPVVLKDPGVLSNFKVYPVAPTIETDNLTGYILGRKIYTYELIPLKPGKRVIPSVEMVIFNPDAGKYITLKTKPIEINVIGKDISSKQLGIKPEENEYSDTDQMQDIYTISTFNSAVDNDSISRSMYLTIAGLLFLPVLISALAYYYLNKKDYADDNPHITRQRKAYINALASLNRLKPLIKSQNDDKYYFELDNILKNYIADKFDLSGGALTVMDIELLLVQSGVSIKNTVFFTEILKLCEMSEYSKGHDAAKKVEISWFDSVKILKSLEKELKNVNKKS